MYRPHTRTAAAVLVDGFARIQRVVADVHAGELDGVRFLYFSDGRRGGRFAYEFFPVATPPAEAIRVAQAIAGLTPHLISAIAAPEADERAAYAGAGYEYWGEETLMARRLASADRALAEATAAVPLTDLAIGRAFEEAQRAAGLRPHPITPDHLDDPDIVHRVALAGGEPASFGRLVVVGDCAYLADVVTLPAFRGRGLAMQVVRGLLADAASLGCTGCVLTSTPMAERLYAAAGFEPVAPLAGYQTPLPGA